LQQTAPLFDHLVGQREQLSWDFKTKRLGNFKIDNQFELDRLLDRQTSRLLAFKDTPDVVASLTESLRYRERQPQCYTLLMLRVTMRQCRSARSSNMLGALFPKSLIAQSVYHLLRVTMLVPMFD
jgi:hypothetical protein